MDACSSLSTQTMVYVIHEIPIFIAMGVVGKDGLGLQVQPSFGRQRSLQPRPCWLSPAAGGPKLPLAGDSSSPSSL